MTIPAWPSDLPYQSQVSDFSDDQLDNPVLSTDMNAGNTRQRRKYTLRISMQKLGIVLTAAQTLEFQAFHQSIGSGAARFTMPVWNGSAYVTRNVAIKDGIVAFSQFAFGQNKIVMTLRIENL